MSYRNYVETELIKTVLDKPLINCVCLVPNKIYPYFVRVLSLIPRDKVLVSSRKYHFIILRNGSILYFENVR